MPIVGAMPSDDINPEPLGFSPQPDPCLVIPDPLRFSHQSHTPVRFSPSPYVQITEGGLIRGVRDSQNEAEQRALSRSWAQGARPQAGLTLRIRRFSFASMPCMQAWVPRVRHSAGRSVQANKAKVEEEAQDAREVSARGEACGSKATLQLPSAPEGEVAYCHYNLNSVPLRFSASLQGGMRPVSGGLRC